MWAGDVFLWAIAMNSMQPSENTRTLNGASALSRPVGNRHEFNATL